MSVPLVYDITRLAARVLRPTPNGIDRIDFAFARHFIQPDAEMRTGMMLTATGRRLLAAKNARSIVERVGLHWGEGQEPNDDMAYCEAVAWLTGDMKDPPAVRRIQSRRTSVRELGHLVRNALATGQAFAESAPKGAVYLNVSQFPLWIARYFSWVRKRPDIKLVFYVHDLLPIETPEFFRREEFERHRRRLNNVAAFGSGVIVSSEATAAALRRYLASLGRSEIPIFVAPPPAAPIFFRRDRADSRLAGQRYFIACGTIEPRKNHLLLLHIWRELIRREGASAPKLVLVGARGWENENVIDLLERCSGLRNHVVEVSGLSTPGFKQLLVSASGLLMPSFAEGYGLPIVEALAANVPVIASDLEIFREIGKKNTTTISPIDGEKWLTGIQHLANISSTDHQTGIEVETTDGAKYCENYFDGIDKFLSKL